MHNVPWKSASTRLVRSPHCDCRHLVRPPVKLETKGRKNIGTRWDVGKKPPLVSHPPHTYRSTMIIKCVSSPAGGHCIVPYLMLNVSIFPSVALCNHVFHDSFTTSHGRHTTPIHVHFLPTSFNGVGIESGNHDDTRSLVKQIYNTIPLFHPFSIILLHMADIAPASHYICGRTLHL